MRLHVEAAGPEDGAPVVFLHGVSGSMRTYAWLPAEITEGRRIVRVDLRGHGRSGHAPGAYDVDSYGEDVVEVLRETVGRPAVLVGHSLGGVVAWWVAQRHPELVAAAFLEDPPLYMGEPAEHELNGAVPHLPGHPRHRRALEGARASTSTPPPPSWPRRPSAPTARARRPRACATTSRPRGPRRCCRWTRACSRERRTARRSPPPTRPPPSRCPSSCWPPTTRRARPSRRATPSAWPSRTPTWRSSASPGAGHGIHDERDHRGDYVAALARFLATHA